MVDVDVDVLVVGAGTAGLVAARTARSLGASVLLAERGRFGGDCLWTGCVPSKALIAAAEAAAQARSADRFGVHTGPVRIDGAAVVAHVHAAVARIEPADSPASLHEDGIRTLSGNVVLSGADTGRGGAVTATVAGTVVRAGRVVLATGATPTVPDLPGLAALEPDTTETLWDSLSRAGGLPGRLAVIGGGPVGCEIAQAMARLGVAVTLVHSGSRLLHREDPQASRLVTDALRADGVHVLTDSRAAGFRGDREGGQLDLSGNGSVAFDRVLVAVGRTPSSSGLGLAAVGVDTDPRGAVRADGSQRTSNDRIWAAGDVTGPPYFTHLAGVAGSNAATNAVLGLHRQLDPDAVPRVTFTRPEVAAIGITDPGARRGLHEQTITHDELDRAIADADTAGFTRLILDRFGRLVGATIVGPRAGESLGELSLAVTEGVRSSTLAGAVHAYPTYSDGVWNAAVADVRARLRGPVVSRAIGLLTRIRTR